jgi:hypothetical protein
MATQLPDFSGLNQQRGMLRNLKKQQLALDVKIAMQQDAIDAALSSGQRSDLLQAEQQSMQQQRNVLAEQLRQQNAEIDRTANTFLGALRPEDRVATLDGGQPIALLPMRLETRYFPPQAPVSLRIRVYPDDINTLQHMSALTESERQAGMAYWRAQCSQDIDEAKRLARDLAQSHGRGRSGWILRVLQPVNLIDPDQPLPDPEFPSPTAMDARAKQTRAVLLPDRVCAIGYASGKEVFRVWGERIADELALSPDWLSLESARNSSQPEALANDERAWLTNFDVALAKGMALEIKEADCREGFILAKGTLERLLIVGVEWTKDAAQTASELADLLSGQRDSQGLGFIPLGTPTNNTESAPSGFSPQDEREPALTVSENASLPQQNDALELLNHAFGLESEQLRAEGIKHAHLAEQRIALHTLNALWRGTFGNYLAEQWNPPLESGKAPIMNRTTLNELRQYALAYLRPAGALPLLRIGKQPYGILPVVGKQYAGVGESKLIDGIATVLKVMRPIWEMAAQQKVPLLKDGKVDKAKSILQTNAWSQTAFYRNGKPLAQGSFSMFGNPVAGDKLDLINQIFNAFESDKEQLFAFHHTHIATQGFLPDSWGVRRGSISSPIAMTGVPWVLADRVNPTQEAAAEISFSSLGEDENYLRKMAQWMSDDKLLNTWQSGPTLFQSLLSYSVQMEKSDSQKYMVEENGWFDSVPPVVQPRWLNIQSQTSTTVNTPAELANTAFVGLGGKTLKQHFDSLLQDDPDTVAGGSAVSMAKDLAQAAAKTHWGYLYHIRALQLSLNYLADCRVGELNWACKTTLDAFSWRLDAWYGARANRRLYQLRDKKATGLYVGGFAWVENLRPDGKPDSAGYLLAPSLSQAATAAILRSGFMANQEQGAFNIELDSKRTRKALDILQGLTRDQPLAALYGYQLERGLRDAGLGQFIYPLRLTYPWKVTGIAPPAEAQEAIGVRDVVDGVALLEAWEKEMGEDVNKGVSTKVLAQFVKLAEQNPGETGPSAEEWASQWRSVGKIVKAVIDIADSVGDLLMAEGVYQIAQGNFDRASAAMAVADKQTIPIEPEINKTPRGGASYTQRLALLCPEPGNHNWPDDTYSATEPRLNAWLARMLGDPARYQFSAIVQRKDRIIDKVSAGLPDLGLSALSAVLSATTLSGTADTGFRERVVAALTRKIDDLPSVTGLAIEQEGAQGRLGLGDFEAIASTLRPLLDKARPITRKDLVVPEDIIEKDLPDEGEYPGVDLSEIRGRADALIQQFTALTVQLAQSDSAASLLDNVARMADFVPPVALPREIQLIKNPGAGEDELKAALSAMNAVVKAKLEALNPTIDASLPAPEPTPAPGHAQQVLHAITQIKQLLGKDFPVLPVMTLGAYATEFNQSLGNQNNLTLGKPWQISGCLPKLARVHEGVEHFVGALNAHEALVEISRPGDFKVVQYPYSEQQIWAALPEAWRAQAMAEKKVPEELHDYLKKQNASYQDINRLAPKLALLLHNFSDSASALNQVDGTTRMAGLVFDEWAEFIPDPFQTAGISFHYDAPGARPPQSILLALPPNASQENWNFNQLLDVVHEAFDLAKIRAVRPGDLSEGIRDLLPGNFLPQSYANAVPGVGFRKMTVNALQRQSAQSIAGKP